MEERANALRKMKICRFCLSEEDPLTIIYEKDGKQSVPLPLQIMACVAIEVFANDGMPQLICKTCRDLTQQAYTFKTTCKRSDDALKLFVATGNLIKPSFGKRPIVQEDEESQVPASKKRGLQDGTQENLQKKKKAEIVTLNYSTPLEIPRGLLPEEDLDDGSDEEEEEEEEEPEEIMGMEDDVERFEEIAEHNMDEQNAEDQEEDDENINPVLKVPQGRASYGNARHQISSERAGKQRVQTDVFPCPHCERSFPLKQLLDIHMKNHERERCFACDACGRKFFTKYDLGKHVQTHSDLKPFTCVVCRKQFSRESLLHRHEKIHIDVPKYLCTFCDRTFLTRDDLDTHAEKHKKKRPFACRLCNKSFVFKQGLERHELTHADQKPHKCNYCEASFTSPIKLTRHITSHAGLRPYPCKLCGRTFLLSHHLTRHMRSHYAAKSANIQPIGQHKCDVCSMSFRRKDSLINHSAIHSMVNLKCVICNTAFDSAKMVKEHITTHLSGLPYPCDRCDYSFETQDQLEEHELKHAEMEYEEQIEKEICLEAQQSQDNDEDDYNSGEDDVAEFTITNTDNPEVIRRSKRETKIKNYAQFLKDELGSDLEDEVVDEESGLEDEEEETIKPVVRMEGTKVYTRKSSMEKPRQIPMVKPPEMETVPLEQITQPQMTSFENLGLTKQAVNALPNKKYVDMKIGDKTVRVQKLMMSRAEIEAMAREGKIEMKGNTILLKNPRPNLQDKTNKNSGASEKPAVPTSKPISLQSIIDDTKQVPILPKPIVKKTYVRKVPPQAAVKENSNLVQIKAEDPGATASGEASQQSFGNSSRSQAVSDSTA